MVPRRVSVRVPASASNLGPGFDVFGLALGLWNELAVSRCGRGLAVEIEGEGERTLARDERNLGVRAFRQALRRWRLPASGLSLRFVNRIPLARGLGSSAATLVAALAAAHAWAGRGPTAAAVLKQALRYEPHADNLVAAAAGGFTLAFWDGAELSYSRQAFPPWSVAAIVPDIQISTAWARSCLPRRAPRAHVAFNVERSAQMLVSMAGRDFEGFRRAMLDRLHEPYRLAHYPRLARLLDRLRRDPDIAACLSGSGSTLLAVFETALARARGVARIRRWVAALGLEARILELSCARTGAQVMTGLGNGWISLSEVDA